MQHTTHVLLCLRCGPGRRRVHCEHIERTMQCSIHPLVARATWPRPLRTPGVAVPASARIGGHTEPTSTSSDTVGWALRISLLLPRSERTPSLVQIRASSNERPVNSHRISSKAEPRLNPNANVLSVIRDEMLSNRSAPPARVCFHDGRRAKQIMVDRPTLPHPGLPQQHNRGRQCSTGVAANGSPSPVPRAFGNHATTHTQTRTMAR